MDQNNKSLKSFERAVLILMIITIAFIWGNSMLSGDASATESGFIMGLIAPFLELFVGKGNVTMHLVRKLAHFTEYFVLGAELTVYTSLRLNAAGNDKKWMRAVIPLGAGFIAASIDETIQMFSSERGPSFMDVLLDFSGICTAFVTATLVMLILSEINRRPKQNE